VWVGLVGLVLGCLELMSSVLVLYLYFYSVGILVLIENGMWVMCFCG